MGLETPGALDYSFEMYSFKPVLEFFLITNGDII